MMCVLRNFYGFDTQNCEQSEKKTLFSLLVGLVRKEHTPYISYIDDGLTSSFAWRFCGKWWLLSVRTDDSIFMALAIKKNRFFSVFSCVSGISSFLYAFFFFDVFYNRPTNEEIQQLLQQKQNDKIAQKNHILLLYSCKLWMILGSACVFCLK